MQFVLMALFAAGIVAVDQWTKYLTVANIALGQDIEFLPNVLTDLPVEVKSKARKPGIRQ